MGTIDRIFGRSPFNLLQRHMEQVTQCVDKMAELLRAVESERWEEIDSLAGEVSKLEYGADQIKDDIRNHLPRPLFMAVDRNRVLDILTIQDRIADRAEDVSVLLTFKRLNLHPKLLEKFRSFRDLNLRAFQEVRAVIGKLDELVESAFGGVEAETVRNMTHRVAHLEHETDIAQRELLKALFELEPELSYGDFYLWTRLIRQLGNVSNHSENLADRVRSTLELK